MADLPGLFSLAAQRAAAYRAASPTATIRPTASDADVERSFVQPLPERSQSPESVLNELVDAAEPGLLNITSPRLFGWVMGGARTAR